MSDVKWEKVGGDAGRAEHGDVWRFPVPGGWIYTTQNRDGTEGTCFVPAAVEARLPAEVSGGAEAAEFRVGDVVAPRYAPRYWPWTKARVVRIEGDSVFYEPLPDGGKAASDHDRAAALRLVSRPAPEVPAPVSGSAGEDALVERCCRAWLDAPPNPLRDVDVDEEDRAALRAVLALLRAEGWGPHDTLQQAYAAEMQRAEKAERDLVAARSMLSHLAEVAGKAAAEAPAEAPAALRVGAKVRVTKPYGVGEEYRGREGVVEDTDGTEPDGSPAMCGVVLAGTDHAKWFSADELEVLP